MEEAVQEKVSSDAKYFDTFNMTAEIAKYDVQLHLNQPIIWYKGNKVETDVLGVYAHLSYSTLALNLIQDIASTIGTKSEVKFILSSLKYDKMIKDNMEKYKDLSREQNVKVLNYADLCVGGLIEAMLEHDISESM
eukprot:15350427-Ditylum_brightwellii.AAC.1